MRERPRTNIKYNTVRLIQFKPRNKIYNTKA